MRVVHSTHASSPRRSSAMAALAVPRRRLRVVATTEDLASLAREVGGDKVTVVALAKGYQDPHFVDPKPSFILEVSRADLLIVVGRELEIGWLPPLINEQPQREDPAGRQRLSRRVAEREDSRDSDRARSRARWATCIRRAIRTTGSTRPTAAASRRRSSDKLEPARRRPTRPTSSSATPTSTSGWPRPRSAGTRRWRPTKARRS